MPGASEWQGCVTNARRGCAAGCGARVHGACHMVPPTAPCRAPQHSRRPACVLGPPRRARNAVWDAGEIICTYCGAHPRAGFDKSAPAPVALFEGHPRAPKWLENHKTAHESGHGCALGEIAVGWSTLRHVRSGSWVGHRSCCRGRRKFRRSDGTFPVANAHPDDPRTFAHTPTNCAVESGPDSVAGRCRRAAERLTRPCRV